MSHFGSDRKFQIISYQYASTASHFQQETRDNNIIMEKKLTMIKGNKHSPTQNVLWGNIFSNLAWKQIIVKLHVFQAYQNLDFYSITPLTWDPKS